MEDQYLIEEETLYIKKVVKSRFVYTKTAGVLLITCVLLIVFEIMRIYTSISSVIILLIFIFVIFKVTKIYRELGRKENKAANKCFCNLKTGKILLNHT